MKKDAIMELNDVALDLFNYMAYNYKKLKLDVTPIQGRILIVIHNNNGMHCQKKLEEFVPCNKSTLSNILKTMEKNGLIKRIGDDDDSRKKNIILTKKAKEILVMLNDNKEKLMQDIMRGISDEEIKSFNDVLLKFKYNIERCKND